MIPTGIVHFFNAQDAASPQTYALILNPVHPAGDDTSGPVIKDKKIERDYFLRRPATGNYRRAALYYEYTLGHKHDQNYRATRKKKMSTRTATRSQTAIAMAAIAAAMTAIAAAMAAIAAAMAAIAAAIAAAKSART